MKNNAHVRRTVAEAAAARRRALQREESSPEFRERLSDIKQNNNSRMILALAYRQ